MQEAASHNAPDHRIIVPHFVIGGLVILLTTVLLFLNPDALTGHFFNGKLLSLTHLAALGWVTMVIFGALCQLIPVILETPLYSEKFALISLLLLTTGAVLLSLSFWQFNFGILLVTGGMCTLLSAAFLVANLVGTSLKSPKKTLEKKFIITASLWLLFTCLAGLTLAINFTTPFLSQSHLDLLKIHAHAGLVGWFVQLIIGVGSKLLPMFMISHELKTTQLKIAYPAINMGLILALVSEFFAFKMGILTGVIITAAGILSFIFYLIQAYKKRVRKKLDAGMKQSALAFFALLIPVSLILLIFFSGNLHTGFVTAYGFLVITGFISSLIMGQTFKTLPFIIWLKEYRGKMGKTKIPLPKDLYSEKSVNLQTWLFTTGFMVVAAAVILQNLTVIQFGTGLMIVALLIYNANVFKIVFHKNKS